MPTSVYSAYGDGSSAPCHAAYAGEIVETDLDCYLLGSRLYHPVLRRFLSPDAISPFDEGGINRYAYCGGDPVNRIDPDGSSFLKWFGAALTFIGAAVATVATGGLAAVALATAVTPVVVVSLTASALSIVADMASTVALLLNKAKLADTLSYIGMGLGALSVASLAKSAAKGAGRVGRLTTKTLKSGLRKLGGAIGVPSRSTARLPSRAIAAIPTTDTASLGTRVSSSGSLSRRASSATTATSEAGHGAEPGGHGLTLTVNGVFKKSPLTVTEKQLGGSQFIGTMLQATGFALVNLGQARSGRPPMTWPQAGVAPDYGVVPGQAYPYDPHQPTGAHDYV